VGVHKSGTYETDKQNTIQKASPLVTPVVLLFLKIWGISQKEGQFLWIVHF